MVYGLLVMAVITLVSVARTVSLKHELRRITAQLKEWNDQQTGKKVDVATSDLDMEQLAVGVNELIDQTKQARADKHRAEQDIKQAIADISHDIRTPTTSILGYIQLLEAGGIPEAEERAYLNRVKGGAERLKELLEDFFELSLLESADEHLETDKIKLNPLVVETVAGFYDQFRRQGLEPELHIAEEPIVIQSNPYAVKRVIENVVLNALKHGNGQVLVRLELAVATAKLTIQNHAPQLIEQEIPRLFDRFYKSDKTRSGTGTGLGLAIAKHYMDKMQGRLAARLEHDMLFIVCEWRAIEE